MFFFGQKVEITPKTNFECQMVPVSVRGGISYAHTRVFSSHGFVFALFLRWLPFL